MKTGKADLRSFKPSNLRAAIGKRWDAIFKSSDQFRLDPTESGARLGFMDWEALKNGEFQGESCLIVSNRAENFFRELLPSLSA
jgi:hypothetical protein